MAAETTTQIAPDLCGVPNTMLWALHNRAMEARRDSVLDDPASERIYQSLDYDFDRNFGIPSGLLAARGAAIDDVLRRWIARHPNGIVVSLGEGLETPTLPCRQRPGALDIGRSTRGNPPTRALPCSHRSVSPCCHERS
jgi:O-methyltransferase involved in polyketide biosynthesis